MKKLNLGCGHDIRRGWINLDSASLPGVDVVHNLEDYPWPFPDGYFEELYAKDVLEHIEYIDALREALRVLKPGGRFMIRVPHFTSADNYIDPTHKKQFSVFTFDFFVKDSAMARNYYFDFAFSEIQGKSIRFLKSRVFFVNIVIERLVNISDRTQRFYEATGMSRLFPAKEIVVTLVK